MAKKNQNNPEPTEGETISMEELEALQADRNKRKEKQKSNPDPEAPLQPPIIPMNPGTPEEERPVDSNETVILTGDAENPEIIVIVDGKEVFRGKPENRPKKPKPEKDKENK